MSHFTFDIHTLNSLPPDERKQALFIAETVRELSRYVQEDTLADLGRRSAYPRPLGLTPEQEKLAIEIEDLRQTRHFAGKSKSVLAGVKLYFGTLIAFALAEDCLDPGASREEELQTVQEILDVMKRVGNMIPMTIRPMDEYFRQQVAKLQEHADELRKPPPPPRNLFKPMF